LAAGIFNFRSRAKSLRNYGAIKRYEHPEIGLNSRLDELQAAILSPRLDWLPIFNARRREIAQKYFSEIDNVRIEVLSRPTTQENHVYHSFVVRCAERNRLADFLREAGIQTLIHYPIAAHLRNAAKMSHLIHSVLPRPKLMPTNVFSFPAIRSFAMMRFNKSSRQLMSSSDHRCCCVNLLFTITTALFTRQAVSKDS
jgi:dTDP-4-amino-4,6-dideoxygalactose transaminase